MVPRGTENVPSVPWLLEITRELKGNLSYKLPEDSLGKKSQMSNSSFLKGLGHHQLITGLPKISCVLAVVIQQQHGSLTGGIQLCCPRCGQEILNKGQAIGPALQHHCQGRRHREEFSETVLQEFSTQVSQLKAPGNG